MIKLEEVVVRVGDGADARSIVDRVSLTVSEGELVAVMGPSGSGKSTLLAVIGGLVEATSGSVCVDGRDVGRLSPDERARLRLHRLGYVFQELNLVMALTAVENVALPLELAGAHRRQARRTAYEALERVGLAARADAFPDDLSGGERQRVAIARATVGARRVLLADEPTGALDSDNARVVAGLLREHAAAGLLVTHDAQIAAYADRVVHLRDGRLDDAVAERAPAVRRA